MPVLYDAPGRQRWVTVTETAGTRFLFLGDAEEGAMRLDSEEPVFDYLWFHKSSALTETPLRRALVLGAGAFTTGKGLALDHPDAAVDAVDSEPDLGQVGRGYFRLDRPEFAGITFHGQPAEDFLAGSVPTYDFVFDDLFDGFQHVPLTCRGAEHFARLRRSLAEGGLCVKNLIWDPHGEDTRAACTEATAGLRAVFATHAVVALGDPSRGHNLLLLGLTGMRPFEWATAGPRLAAAGVPEAVLRQVHVMSFP
jgi:hypothetical protein